MPALPRPFPTRLLAMIFAATLGGVLSAEDLIPLKLRYHRLTLSNGRVLQDVTLNSLNRESGLIYVFEEQHLKPYPAVLFPGFVGEAIDRQIAERPEGSPRENTDAPTPPSSSSPDLSSDLPKPIGSPAAPAADLQAVEAALIAKAEKAALTHLRYRIRTGSGYATVTDAAIELDPPESIDGWAHRYRIKGEGYYTYYESVGGAFQRRTRGLEILLEAPSPNRIKVLEINTLWSRD